MQHVYRTIIIIIIKNKICTASSSCTSVCAFRLRASFPRGSLARAARSCAGASACPPGGTPSPPPPSGLSFRPPRLASPQQSAGQLLRFHFRVPNTVRLFPLLNTQEMQIIRTKHQRSIKVIVKVKNHILLLW